VSAQPARGVVHRIPRPVHKLTESDVDVIFEEQGGPLTRQTGHGPEIMCPACERWDGMFSYIKLWYAPKYAEHLIAVIKCHRRDCGHVFALRP
jgi:hypothetical protein